MRLWIFKAEDGSRAKMWVQVLTEWRDYISYQLMADSNIADTLDDKAGKRKSSFFGSMLGWSSSKDVAGGTGSEGARSPSKRNSMGSAADDASDFSRSRSASGSQAGSHTESEFSASEASGDFE